MRFKRLVAVMAGLAPLASGAAFMSASAQSPMTPASGAATAGLHRLEALHAASDVAVGIATFDSVPDAPAETRLEALGLEVQGMKHLPLAIMKGSVGAMEQAVATGAANDVYPDDHLQLLDTASSDAMGSAAPRTNGFTGQGVTVAVVDSGCDATQPDLADHVAHNVTLLGPEYANQPPDPHKSGDGALVVPIDSGPYNNSDLGGGHGTHVAGIVAADGHTGADHVGVAPDASLVCYSIGEVLFTTAVISAYDHMIDHPEWSIDVVNNSWGNPFLLYDPDNPVNIATKAVADRGVVVVFAAGNSGSGEAELSLNPFSEAPWVISVAAGSLDHQRGDFSSNGAEYDNSFPVAPGSDGHISFTGTRVGLYHPDVTAPGVNISSTCDSLGTVVGPCPPGENTEASGTSMASPHVAGAAALVLQANPKLTPTQLFTALTATATKVVKPGTNVTAPFWEAGYGYVDLSAAVDLVRRSDYATQLTSMQRSQEASVIAGLPWKATRSDFWTWDAPHVTVAGVPDTKTFTVPVSSSANAVKVALAYPSAGTVGLNGMSYVATVTDASGRVLGTTTANDFNGSSSLLLDLAQFSGLKYGRWTITVTGDRAVSDPDTIDSDSDLGRMVTTQVALLTH